MRDYRRAVLALNAGAAAVTKTSKIEFFEAQDAGGTGAQALEGKEITVTANVNVVTLTIALDTVLAGESITINGLEFTAHADTTTAADREFSIAGNDAADAAALAGLINNATYGVPGVVATVADTTITLNAGEPGSVLISASSGDATFTIATVAHQAFVECSHFDLSPGFSHLAAKVTTTANTTVSALLMRGDPREGVSNAPLE